MMNPTIWGALVFAFLQMKFCRFTAELGIFAAECEVARISRQKVQGQGSSILLSWRLHCSHGARPLMCIRNWAARQVTQGPGTPMRSDGWMEVTRCTRLNIWADPVSVRFKLANQISLLMVEQVFNSAKLWFTLGCALTYRINVYGASYHDANWLKQALDTIQFTANMVFCWKMLALAGQSHILFVNVLS